MYIHNNLKYSEDHEWVLLEGDSTTIGISDYAQNAMGDVVFVELPEVGDTLEAGQPFGVIESVKAVSDLLAPISGEVIAINDELADTPDKVNSSPYEEAWMVKVKLADDSGLDALMDAESYQSHIDGL